MSGRTRSFGPVQLARYLGWHEFQIRRGVRLGLLPRPDKGSRWSGGLAKLPTATTTNDDEKEVQL